MIVKEYPLEECTERTPAYRIQCCRGDEAGAEHRRMLARRDMPAADGHHVAAKHRMRQYLRHAGRSQHTVENLTSFRCDLVAIRFLGIGLSQVSFFESRNRSHGFILRKTGKSPGTDR